MCDLGKDRDCWCNSWETWIIFLSLTYFEQQTSYGLLECFLRSSHYLSLLDWSFCLVRKDRHSKSLQSIVPITFFTSITIYFDHFQHFGIFCCLKQKISDFLLQMMAQSYVGWVLVLRALHQWRGGKTASTSVHCWDSGGEARQRSCMLADGWRPAGSGKAVQCVRQGGGEDRMGDRVGRMG